MFVNSKISCNFALTKQETKTHNPMNTKMPLYLLDAGMDFRYKKETYTLCGIADNGKYEARDKYGLLVEFPCNLAVIPA